MTSHIDPVWLDIAHAMARDLIQGRPVMPTKANASTIIYLIQAAQAQAPQAAEPAAPAPQRRRWRRREEI